ncbi:MAG: BON domain-containing protein [Phycisphaerales bacterium]|nr:BON domain-containing protein [Phycisphaerales bacterium]
MHDVKTTTDQLLCDQVERALRRDERLSSQPLEIAVEDGVVHLTGSVQSYRRKLAAHEIASSFDACRDVINELAVSPVIVPDQQVADGVRAALDAHADITRETITVTARNGVVTLGGHAHAPWERMTAQDVAMACRGVRDVDNQILVDRSTTEKDENLASDILDALRVGRGLSDADLHVAVNEAAIVLSGSVRTLGQKQTADAIARRFRPWIVRNEIRVTG